MAGARGEAARKLIHVGVSLVAAAVVWTLPPVHAAAVLAAATALALTVELLRRASPRFRDRFRRALGPMLRHRESERLTGATTLAVGYTLAATLLPGTPALAGILLAGVADAAAAVVGKRFGRRRYRGGKSVEGSVAFFAVSLPLLALLGLGPDAVFLVAAVATIVEAPTLRADDNLYLPLAVAAAVSVTEGVLPSAFFS